MISAVYGIWANLPPFFASWGLAQTGATRRLLYDDSSAMSMILRANAASILAKLRRQRIRLICARLSPVQVRCRGHSSPGSRRSRQDASAGVGPKSGWCSQQRLRRAGEEGAEKLQQSCQSP